MAKSKITNAINYLQNAEKCSREIGLNFNLSDASSVRKYLSKKNLRVYDDVCREKTEIQNVRMQIADILGQYTSKN